MSSDILFDSLHMQRKDTEGHFEQEQGPMRQSGLKGVLENDWNAPRNTQFNEPAQKRGPLRDSFIRLNMKIIILTFKIKISKKGFD